MKKQGRPNNPNKKKRWRWNQENGTHYHELILKSDSKGHLVEAVDSLVETSAIIVTFASTKESIFRASSRCIYCL